MKRLALLAVGLAFLFGTNKAQTLINVPADYKTIQDAIDHSMDGDTVLVAPGTYYENISFNGKAILLTSNFIYHRNFSQVSNTIINGSKSTKPDSASCVTFDSNEGKNSIIQGFTLTGGTGTESIYPGDGVAHRGGGGILVDHSSPTIRFNYIYNNGKTDGRMNGAGIDAHNQSSPLITNNVIAFNKGSFGVGLCLWEFASATVKNNIIAYNTGAHWYGGAGIGIDLSSAIIENNTIANNYAFGNGADKNGTGGGIVIWNYNDEDGKTQYINNIIWGNMQQHGNTVELFSLTETDVDLSYSFVEGGFEETQNYNESPLFAEQHLMLLENSPAIDAGSPESVYNDKEDSNNLGNALFPSQGTITNDIGAYGGSGATPLHVFDYSRLVFPKTKVDFGSKNEVDSTSIRELNFANIGNIPSNIDSLKIQSGNTEIEISLAENMLSPMQNASININWLPTQESDLKDTLLIYHNSVSETNPIKILISGKAKVKPVGIIKNVFESVLVNYPNPFTGITTISYSTNSNNAKLLIYNAKGQLFATYNNLKGKGNVEFNANNLPSGIYFGKLIDNEHNVKVIKMTVL